MNNYGPSKVLHYLGLRETDEGLCHVFSNGVTITYQYEDNKAFAIERARQYFYGC